VEQTAPGRQPARRSSRWHRVDSVKDQRTILRAGYGLFYDHIPRDVYTFGRYPMRTITNYNPDGSLNGRPFNTPTSSADVRGPRSFFINGQQVAGGVFPPRGATLNLQIEHACSKHVRIRGVYTDNHSVGLVTLQPDAVNEIVLNGDASRATARWKSPRASIGKKSSWSFPTRAAGLKAI